MASVAGDLLLRALNGGSVPSVNLDFLAQVADGLLVYFTRELGFDNAYDFARYLQAAVRVVEPRFTARHGGYRDVEGLVCSDGVVLSTTEPALRVFWRLVWHLKHDHGLVNLEDIEGEAEVGRDRVNFILTNMRGLESLMGWLSDGIAARGLVKDGKCALCGGEVGDDPFEVVLHFVNWHREQAESLFSSLGQSQEPQVLDMLEDAAREVAQRLGVDFELALGVVKTVYSVINIEGALSVDEIMLHMNFYDPALTTRLTGIDVRHLVLAVKEALEARGLIDVRVKEKAQLEAKAEAKPEEPHSSEPQPKAKDVEQPEESKPEAGAKANTGQPEAKPNEAHPSGCRPEDVGAKPEDRDTILFQLACALYREFGKPGNYMALASELLSELRKGNRCSEKALLKLGYGNIKPIIRALKRLKMC
jgi:hypothetical protein